MTTPPRSRYESLDIWRGVACLAVVVFHATFYQLPADSRTAPTPTRFAEWGLWLCYRGWIGVPMFFVISGYCIAAAADRHRNRGGSATRFFLRRFRRIYPPLWVAMLSWAAIASLIPASDYPGPSAEGRDPLPRVGSLTAWQWVGNITLTEEWRPHVVGPPRNYLLGQAWTLCYEEQFYLLVGLILVMAPRGLFAVMAIVSVAVYLNIADIPVLAGWQWPARGFFFDGQWLAFAAGVVVYFRIVHASPVVGYSMEFLLIAGAIIMGAHVLRDGILVQNLPGSLTIAFAFAWLLCRLHPCDVRFSSTRCLAPMRFCGRMCYSLYLVHTPVTILLAWNLLQLGCTSPGEVLAITVPVCVAASVLVAYLFYRLVERRCLNSGS